MTTWMTCRPSYYVSMSVYLRSFVYFVGLQETHLYISQCRVWKRTVLVSVSNSGIRNSVQHKGIYKSVIMKTKIMSTNNAQWSPEWKCLLSEGLCHRSRLHLLSMGMPFMAQVMEGLGVPLALQVSTPFSPGARTRFLGVPLIQYGAAENRREHSRRLEN